MLWAIVAYGMLIFMAAFCTGLVMNILQGAVRVAVQNGSQSSNRRQWRADCLREKMELVAAAQKLWSGRWGKKGRDIGMLNNATISIIYGDG